ncbi:MAG: sodium:calcium antiporter, partial [Lachnospiraceae bacterium]|nr:sodium:calcium antiporter [Lachnospiraceae bacterium]
QNLIGLTIVAFGTSLPELVTSVVAARKKEAEMALGNVIGSNIFNILFVLGIAAAISPIRFYMENIIDIIVLVGMSMIVLVFCWTKEKLVRWEGIVMLLLYAGYVVYICNR